VAACAAENASASAAIARGRIRRMDMAAPAPFDREDASTQVRREPPRIGESVRALANRLGPSFPRRREPSDVCRWEGKAPGPRFRGDDGSYDVIRPRRFDLTLQTIELETAPNPRHAIIWLHGLGADGNDFKPIVPELVDRAWPSLRFVFPHAPVRAVTINGGMRMRAWYDILAPQIAAMQDEAGMRASIAELDALIAREGERGIAPSRVILAGFSQGGAIVLAGGVRHAAKLAGIVALSTYLPLDAKTAAERSAANAGLPIYMAHGIFDPVVP